MFFTKYNDAALCQGPLSALGCHIIHLVTANGQTTILVNLLAFVIKEHKSTCEEKEEKRRERSMNGIMRDHVGVGL